MKELVCREAGFDCDAVVRSESTEDVMSQVATHAQNEHGVTVTPELRDQLAGLVRDG